MYVYLHDGTVVAISHDMNVHTFRGNYRALIITETGYSYL